MYLYRAIDKQGHTVDFYLSSRRNDEAVKQVFCNRLK
ncbi:DDE-type integrase/transposase/recombinase [Shewanella benthica]|nr:DDE-type integrase/transposase/recombinase [Shewanella benthica]